MERVEQNLDNDVKVQDNWLELVQKLELPELGYEERLKIVNELKNMLHYVYSFHKIANENSTLNVAEG
jgi:hypothetical protein